MLLGGNDGKVESLYGAKKWDGESGVALVWLHVLGVDWYKKKKKVKTNFIFSSMVDGLR